MSRVLPRLSLVTTPIAEICQITGLATRHWSDDGVVSLGLWARCEEGSCVSFEYVTIGLGFLRVAQFFQTVAVLLLPTSFVFGLVSLCVNSSETKSKTFLLISTAAAYFSALCILLGLATFGGKFLTHAGFVGYSMCLCIVSFSFSLLSAIFLSLFQYCSKT